MPIPYSEIHLFLVNENNKEAKFFFTKPGIILPDLLLYECWKAYAEITQPDDIALLNRILNDKAKAIAAENYIWAATYHASEINAVYKLSQIQGMAHNKPGAQRDFDDVRCYLLLRILERNDLHKEFERN